MRRACLCSSTRVSRRSQKVAKDTFSVLPGGCGGKVSRAAAGSLRSSTLRSAAAARSSKTSRMPLAFSSACISLSSLVPSTQADYIEGVPLDVRRRARVLKGFFVWD